MSRRSLRRSFPYVVALLICFALTGPVQAQTGMPAIQEGSTVILEMTISVPDDHFVMPPHTSQYTHGAKQLIPGLEQALVGLHEGEKKRVELDSDHAFGPYDASKKTSIPRAQLPQTITAGEIAKTSDGQPFTVIALADDSAVIDFNHPLAGKQIVLDVVVLKVKPRA